MEIRIVEEADMEKDGLAKKDEAAKKKFEIKEGKGEKCQIKPLKQVPEDMMLCEEVSCQRTAKGMINNCSICENVDNEIFVSCKIKYK